MLGWSLSIPGAILLHQQLNFWSCCCPQVWLPCRKVSAIPGDDLQKYHQMIQAANQTLSLTCFRSFFLDGTFRARHDFCSLLELLVPVWAGASNHRIPAKRQIIFQIELSENSVENARKTADFGIELSENFNR